MSHLFTHQRKIYLIALTYYYIKHITYNMLFML